MLLVQTQWSECNGVEGQVTACEGHASGIGVGLAAFPAHRYQKRVERFVLTAPSKSKLAYAMLGLINSGRPYV